ncbi:AIPR family protein [Mesorhizobium sp. B2-7-3]|uniref:AIPR family protein n=1 Tax=Mesorhizobium sp. B2-7-3 TaxID=2589907 RepID=UPI00112C1AC5|nr:AIPR family protein [Mesorhizobium sp. B2-7-3]TPJ13728.1 AIPR family protein [Mesorhizobium sp. B2-7-3]
MVQDLKEDLRLLHGAVQGSEPGPVAGDQPAECFTRFVIDHLIEIGRVDDGHVAFWEGPAGRGAARISGYGIGEQRDTLDLFITELGSSDELRSARADDLDRLVGQAGRFAEMALKSGANANVDTAAGAMLSAIHDVSGRLRRVRIFIITDAVSAARRMPRRTVAALPAEIEVWDLPRLTRSMSVEGEGEPIDIDFENSTYGCQPFLRLDGGTEHSTLLMVIPGQVLSELYEEHGAALLEFNVRSFLSVRGKVNKGIRDTILGEPGRFLAYNNGIVITAESVYEQFVPGLGKAVAKLTNVQIVNGGQTTATIHDTARRLEADISHVAVAAKVVIVGSDVRDEIVKRISRFANTQNPMQQADLSANEPFHVAVERLSRSTWCPGGERRWFYERARGQYEVELSREGDTPAKRAKFLAQTPKELRFSKVDLAKFLNAWGRRPHDVSLGGQKNFIQLMEDLRRRNGLAWEPDQQWYQDVVAVALIWQTAERVVRWEGIPAFRANVTAYLVALLSAKSSSRLDLKRIWNAQAVTPQLESLLRSWAVPVRDALVQGASARQRNPTEWFKREECWTDIGELPLPMPSPLPSEFGTASREVDLIPIATNGAISTDLAAALRVKTIKAGQWTSIAEWGSRTGKLHWRQSSIATTLSGMSAQQWRKDPSPKQVEAAINILNLVEQQAPELVAQ